jgi:hypothetical protein
VSTGDVCYPQSDPLRGKRVEVVQGSHTDRDVVDKTFDCADSDFWLVPADPQAARVEAAYVDFSRPASEALTD